ncbi:MAG TPA: hypothetical protein VF954_00160 [Acidimicrobiales bacterium]
MKLTAWYAEKPAGVSGSGARQRGLTGTPHATAFAHRPVCIADAVKAPKGANGMAGRPKAPPGGWSG